MGTIRPTLALVVVIGVTSAIGLSAARRQAAAPASPLTGEWRLNKELSSPLPPGDSAAGGPGSSNTPARSGGRGGRTGGFGGRGGSRSAPSSEDALKLRAVRRELGDAAAILTIIVSPTQVTFTRNDGVVRKFATDGKKHEIDLVSAVIDVTTTWEGDALTEVWDAGRTKIAARYQVTVQGKMLVLSIGPEGESGSAKYIYERVE